MEICENLTTDTLTGHTTQRSVRIVSGMRNIYIGLNTLTKIIEFVKSKGGLLPGD